MIREGSRELGKIYFILIYRIKSDNSLLSFGSVGPAMMRLRLLFPHFTISSTFRQKVLMCSCLHNSSFV